MHGVVGGNVGLKVEGNLPGDPGQDGQKVSGVGLSLDDIAQGLDEPTALSGVSPAVESRNSAVSNQKVRVAWYFVGGGSSVMLSGHHLDTMIQLVSLASLDKEHFWFSCKAGALVGSEV